jgi:hypothetical protein
MKASIEIKVGTCKFAGHYTVGETRAVKAYDYGGVIELEGGETRIVAIPDETVPMQTARYASGMHAFKPLDPEDGWMETAVFDTLVAKL